MSETGFAGKSVVVTGAASGIGLAVASAFADAGASVVMCDVSDTAGEARARDLRAGGFDVEFTHLDVSDEESMQACIGSVVAAKGRVDVFVAAAGILGDRRKLLHEQTRENLASVFGVNVDGVVFGMKHVLPGMQRHGSGVVVNFASVQSFRVKSPGASLYAASKAAVVSLTKSAALEYGGDGIRVVAVAPGAIETPMLRSAAGGRWPPSIAAETPLSRVGQPDEVAQAVLWLASDAASFVSGVTLPVDGGWLAP